jgi:16S rRNA (uracil1498-N3)-methyltransferase
MARRLFFVDSIRRGAAAITGEDARHLTRVLRVEPGQRYEISDNRALYLAEVESARKDEVVFRTLEPLPLGVEPVHVVLLAALIKFERFEMLIEKATELGVSAIVPVASTRSERGLERAAEKRVERWRKIAVESSQQARRPRLPGIERPCDFEKAVARSEAIKTPGGLGCSASSRTHGVPPIASRFSADPKADGPARNASRRGPPVGRRFPWAPVSYAPRRPPLPPWP